MNIYLLQRTSGVGYDEVSGFVIAAMTVADARKVAASRSADEGKSLWRSVPCQLVGKARPDVTAGIVMRSFNAG